MFSKKAFCKDPDGLSLTRSWLTRRDKVIQYACPPTPDRIGDRIASSGDRIADSPLSPHSPLDFPPERACAFHTHMAEAEETGFVESARVRAARILDILDEYRPSLFTYYSEQELVKYPLHRAAEQGSVEAVKALLAEFPDEARHADEHGWYPLHEAAWNGSFECVEAILTAYPEAAQKHTEPLLMQTPLELAAGSGNGDSVVAIMEAYPEAATEGIDHEGRYPVEYMLEAGDMWASSEDFAAKLRAAKLLLDALPKCFSRFPFETKEIEVSKDVKPHLQIMVALTRAGYPPSRPWTPSIGHAMRGISAGLGVSGGRDEVIAIIQAHMSRVRTFLLVASRFGLRSDLAHDIVGRLYAMEFVQPAFCIDHHDQHACALSTER